MSGIFQESLASGYKLVAKQDPQALSVSIGIFTRASLVYESEEGIAHFLEHMIFRGTQKRSAKQITQEVDALGGKINAYTARDYTCFHIKVLPEALKKALDLLTDIFFHSKLSQADCELEKNIISEEIAMLEDTPDDYIFDLIFENAWPQQDLGRPILGSRDSIKAIDSNVLKAFYDYYLSSENTVISVVGNFDSKHLITYLNRYLKSVKNTQRKMPPILAPSLVGGNYYLEKQSEQSHLALAFLGVSQSHPDKYGMSFLATILGGSMSSRLFQEIREKRGLAYSVFAYHSMLNQAGLLIVYAGVQPKNTKKAYQVILRELEKLCQKPLNSKEFKRVRSQLKGQLLLGLERPSSWLTLLGKRTLFNQKIESIEDIIDSISAVDPERVQLLAAQAFRDQKSTCVLLGPNKPQFIDAKALNRIN